MNTNVKIFAENIRTQQFNKRFITNVTAFFKFDRSNCWGMNWESSFYTNA